MTHILGAADTTSAIQLESSRVDLSKHVGEKVSVRGVEAGAAASKATLTVSAIVKLAKSCS